MNEYVIFVLFVVIICIVTYFDFYRYFYLHNFICKTNDFDEYIEYYQELSKLDEIDSKVVISFSTTPDKIRKIRPMIKSILDQSVKVDKIILNLPDTCERMEYKVPEDYKDVLNVYNCGKDYGYGNKFIPTLLRESDYGTILIMLDDEYIYGYDFIEKLLFESIEYPNRMIYSEGAMLVKPEFFRKEILNIKESVITENVIKKYIKVNSNRVKYYKNIKSYKI